MGANPRRAALAAAAAGCAAAVLQGCGFHLRGAQTYAFQTLAVEPNPGGPAALELRRTLASSLRVLPAGRPLKEAEVVLRLLQEQRERVVVGVNASGQVRELQLRLRARFSAGTLQGAELIPETELLLTRDVTYNETAALAKEAEEALLYRDMQSDLVQQLQRRLAALKP